MKKQVLILCLCLFGGIGTVSAQLKVTSDGKIAIQTTGTPVCPIAINGTGNSGYHVAVTGEKCGLHCKAMGENTTNTMYGGYFTTALSTSHTSVGLRGVAGNSSATLTTHSCYGVMAIAAGGRRNIGVLGKIDGTGGGAGVYGSIGGLDYGTPLFADQNRYAGYFNGDTKVTGNLIVGGTIEGVLLGESLSSSPNIASYEEIGADRRSIADCLSTITVGKYKYVEDKKQNLDSSYAKMEAEEFGDSIGSATLQDWENVKATQREDRPHYALSAEDLESLFPELVYTRKDGSKAVNYIELIPLLVQSINELNERLATYEKGENSPLKVPVSTMTKAMNYSTAQLYQNTPNPFTERTEIRFMVPEDAQSAFIYIFDMTGKMLRQIPVDASMQRVTINGYELSAGIYLYSLAVNGQEIDTKRMILSK